MSAEYLQLTHRHERTSEQAEESDCLLRSGVNSLVSTNRNMLRAKICTQEYQVRVQGEGAGMSLVP